MWTWLNNTTRFWVDGVSLVADRICSSFFQTAAMKMTEESDSNKQTFTVEEVQKLIKKKDEIEEQIKAYYEVLEDVSLIQNNSLIKNEKWNWVTWASCFASSSPEIKLQRQILVYFIIFIIESSQIVDPNKNVTYN